MERFTEIDEYGIAHLKEKNQEKLTTTYHLALNQLADYEDKVESGELIPKSTVMEKIETIIDELVEIGFMDSQCQVKGCHKSDKIQCGDSVCIEENQKIWKTKILEALK